MTKSDLIEAIAMRSPEHTRRHVEGAVNTIFDAVTEALVRGERVEIRGLGTFRVKARNARTGRNPRTGEAVEVPARRIPHFVVGKGLRARVEA